MAPHAFLLLLCLALLNIHVLAANQYVIHFNVPLSATGQDPIQLQQWQDAATQAASEVSSAWSSSTGDTLVVDVLDDQGDVVVAASNAVRSAVNSSVSAILAAGLDSVSDAMELTARGFSVCEMLLPFALILLPCDSELLAVKGTHLPQVRVRAPGPQLRSF